MTTTTSSARPGPTRKITIHPVTRVEGHGKVTIHLDARNTVTEARLHIVEFRGFERFILGRPYWEVPVIVQRLCGICPVSHHLAAAKAMDRIVGGEQLTPTAEKMRRLMHYGQIFQSHALHFFHLSSPDLLFGTDGTARSAFGAPPAQRNILAVAARYPDLARQGVMMRKFGQEVIRVTAGKKIHGTGAIPGGVNKNLSIAERDALLEDVPQMLEWSRRAVGIIRDFTMAHLDELRPFGSFESNHLSLVGQDDGALDLYHGVLRAVDSQGQRIVNDVDYQRYLDVVGEEVRSWSYMKFPFLKSLGPKTGWYRVGPLARLNTCAFIPSPEAEAARQDFFALTQERPNNITMCYHWARIIELLHAIEVIGGLLEDPDLQGDDLLARGPRREETVGVVEAPRGTLFHHYRVNRNDEVTLCNLIVSTTNNNEPMNRAITRVARDVLGGRPEISEGLLNHIEVAIRAYDPCLSCATHATGQMALSVCLIGPNGELLEQHARH
ncbi:MAG: Ni/Fe hydrogenase subunit alpha [Verrucomicrobia bacterium]|jgi:NAD-reducing hydrogenase large subunit|nr:Ni/Fe hydrogenase subunit alpha [Verrucomicrobiota bacterium]OQC67432.1 MAG: NAD-reducing hydrogenase HoxS subunit beta [Verrucomicrobia bacterium ADurb.Bin006]MDI9380157.1 Ni/Fe hydrogenase subunit alpha [Verrucomicrobiota bacterium]HNU99918.1 Ni/Fe hydrogenase subunit alpha [Verrucomicrobiota bacterium]HOA60042.1 Ni/Fe hydrogenase subunit alpha [Verrucomicrobiota bacterium]